MALSPLQLLMAVLAIVAFRVTLRNVRSQLSHWSRSSWLTLLIVILPNATTAVGELLNERVKGADAFFRAVISYTGVASQVNRIASPLLLAVSILVLAIGLNRRTINAALLVFAGLLVVGAVLGTRQGFPLITGGRLTLLAVILAAAFTTPGRSAILGVSVGAGILVTLGAAAVISNPGVASACDTHKCGAFSSAYAGISDNGNIFGLFLAASIPFFYFAWSSGRRAMIIVVLILIVATGDRTAQIAGFVTVAVLYICRPDLDGVRRARRLPGAVAVVAMGIMAVLPFAPLPPDSLSTRPALWLVARRYLSQDWLGHGPSLWTSLVERGEIPTEAGYATHNQLLEVLFVAGWIGALLTIILIVATAAQAGNRRTALWIFALPTIIMGISERPWSLGQIDALSWVIVGTLLAVDDREKSTSRMGRMKSKLVDPRPAQAIRSSEASYANGFAGMASSAPATALPIPVVPPYAGGESRA